MLQFITSFLNERSFQVRINDHILEKYVLEIGVPQESPLIIRFLLAAINNLLDEISHLVKSIMFTNDTCSYLNDL